MGMRGMGTRVRSHGASEELVVGLQAVLVVADADTSLTITGNGDVLEPYDGIIGEGGRPPPTGVRY